MRIAQRSGDGLSLRTVTVARRDGSSLCTAEVADRFWSRAWGLLGRKRLDPGRALWIKPCRSVHTLFMRFPIDVVYLDGAGTVVKVSERLRPFRLSSGGNGTASVLELVAGATAAESIRVGETLVISRVGSARPSS